MSLWESLIRDFSWLLTLLAIKKPPVPTPPTIPPTPPQSVTPPTPPIVPKYLWDTPDDIRHSIRVICDEEGLTVAQKNDMCATIKCESNFDLEAKHVNGKTTDWGLCQINDYYHIGVGKDFPSVDYVLNNPEAVVRWMARLWKNGRGILWVCYSKGYYKNYM